MLPLAPETPTISFRTIAGLQRGTKGSTPARIYGPAARTPYLVIPILVDERRLAAGLDAALATLTARAAGEIVTPAAFLERLTGVRVVGDAGRRAIVRRIAATRDDIGLPPHICASSSFAARVVAALDETGERTPFETLIEHYRTLLAFANV